MIVAGSARRPRMDKARQWSAAGLAALATALVPAPSLADNAANGFAGQWNTNASGLVGVLKLSVVDGAAGAQELSSLGGVPCPAPTTYYHGDYHDTMFPVGTFAACVTPAGHLGGRFEVSLG